MAGLSKILITEPDEIASQAIEMLKNKGYETIVSADGVAQDEIKGLFIRTYTQATREYLDRFPDLKFILRAGVGTDNIDLEECEKRNIKVFNAPGSNANAVSEYVLTMMFLLLRNIPIQTERLKSNQWREKSYIGAELRDKKIGLVGCGAVGKTLATKLQVFGPKIYGYDPFVDAQTMSNFSIEKCEFLDLLSIADVVSLQLTLNANTRNMIGKEELMRMKKSAVLINVSRGELVKENDLIWALENGIIAGAALDVFVDEPHVNQALLNIPNLILTPHIAGFTKEANVQMAMGAVENMLRVSV